MRLMQIASSEWRNMTSSIEAGSTPAGVFLARGPSEEIAVQAQAVLEDTFLQGYPIRYFLCSDNNIFRVPCFLPLTGKQPPEPLALDITRLFQARQDLGELVVHNTMIEVLKELEQTVRREHRDPRLILLEYLTPPAEFDLAFTILLLKSVLPQHIPLVMLVHQQGITSHVLWRYRSAVESMLSLLYMSGGRLRQADWHNLKAQFPEQSLCTHFITSRRVGSDVWVCYANRQVADMAGSIFQGMEQRKKHKLARSLLQILPHYTGYPLLAIASETNDLQAMLSSYSQGALETAFSEPEGVVRYFDGLQQVAQTAGDPTMASKAHMLSLAAQVLRSKAHAAQVYKRLRGALPGKIDKETENLFWSLLGQRLVASEYPQDWECAAECFRLCRESVKSMSSVSQDAVQLSLVAIANGEALIASKLRHGEKARELEEFALAQLQGRPEFLTSQAHARINLGDVFLRLLGDVEAALTQYGEALLAISQACKKLKHKLTPEQARPYKQKASLKLGNALLQVGRCEEAIEILEYLLGYLERAPGLNRVGEAHAAEVLKTRRALAQAYLKTGHQRKAALCYWRILRHPQWLDPADLKDIVAKLHDCHPALPERLQVYMERAVSEQEAIRADVMKIKEVLTGMANRPQMVGESR